MNPTYEAYTTLTVQYEMGATVHTEEYDVTVRGTVSQYHPAKVYGPPELCYPAEGGEVELLEFEAAVYPGGSVIRWSGAEFRAKYPFLVDAAEQALFDAAQEDRR